MSSPDNWLENAIIFGVYPSNGGGGGGGVTPRQVQEFAFNYEPATGVNDAFVVILTPAVTVLTDGLIVSMSTGLLYNETDSPTLQINALPPTPIVLWGSLLAPGDIEPNASYLFIYNESTNTFQLINPSISTANAFLVQANAYNSAIDTGAVNDYVVTLLVEPQSSFDLGFPIYMRVSAGHDNTGASTLTVNGVTDAIVLNDGSPIPAGALVGNRLAYFSYNGAWVLMNPAVTGTGFVQSVTGADVKQVIVDNADPENPVLSLPQDIDVDSDVAFNGVTTVTDIVVNSINIGQGPFTDSLITNTRIGNSALPNNVSGLNNTAVGRFALEGVTLGSRNAALGAQTGSVNDGDDNCFFGYLSSPFLGILSNGNNNVSFGSNTGTASAGEATADFQGGSDNTWLGFGVSGEAEVITGTIGIGKYAAPGPRTGATSSDVGPQIAIGSANTPVGFRGDNTAYPAGGANYWRMRVNGTYYKLPILPDATALEWPAGPGTIALLSDILSPQWINVTTATVDIVPGAYYIANYTGGVTVFNLPATAAFGTEFRIKGGLSGSGWQITQRAGQQINVGQTASTTVGVTGTLNSTRPTDYVSLTCLTADLYFSDTGFTGSLEAL